MKTEMRTQAVIDKEEVVRAEKRNEREWIIARLLVAALEAMGSILLFAKLSDTRIELWETGWTTMLFFLLLLFYLLIMGKKSV